MNLRVEEEKRRTAAEREIPVSCSLISDQNLKSFLNVLKKESWKTNKVSQIYKTSWMKIHSSDKGKNNLNISEVSQSLFKKEKGEVWPDDQKVLESLCNHDSEQLERVLRQEQSDSWYLSKLARSWKDLRIRPRLESKKSHSNKACTAVNHPSLGNLEPNLPGVSRSICPDDEAQSWCREEEKNWRANSCN